jgi:hypothetical protein
MICHHTRFQTPTSNGSLVIAVEQRGKNEVIRNAAMLFHVPYKKYLNKTYIFANGLLNEAT